jgi:transposase-like protein
MTGTRKGYPAAFKARVTLEAAKQTRTLAELSESFQVHPVQISQWKKQLLDGAESLFRDGRRRDRDEGEALQAELYQQIGRLNMEVEWLKKSSRSVWRRHRFSFAGRVNPCSCAATV